MTIRSCLTVGAISVALLTASSVTACELQSRPSTSQTAPQLRSVAQPVASQTLAQANSLPAIQQAIHQKVNQHRASRGLPPLTLDARISQQALLHSQAMAKSGKLSHDGFQQRTAAIARVIPLRGAGENVAYNMGHSDPAAQAMQGWLNSRGHRQNIEGRYDLTGIGVARNAKGEYYFTQIFVQRR